MQGPAFKQGEATRVSVHEVSSSHPESTELEEMARLLRLLYSSTWRQYLSYYQYYDYDYDYDYGYGVLLLSTQPAT